MDAKIKNISQEIIQLENPLYVQLLNQVNKDFTLCGIKWENYSMIPPENLFEEVNTILQNLLCQETEANLYALLYRIDISEKVIRQTNFTNVSEITTLVLSREMEKIWLRIRYSK